MTLNNRLNHFGPFFWATYRILFCRNYHLPQALLNSCFHLSNVWFFLSSGIEYTDLKQWELFLRTPNSRLLSIIVVDQLVHLCITKRDKKNMKSKFNVLVFACILSSFATSANSPASMKVTSSPSASVFNITYRSQEEGKVTISIYNKKNQLVFTEKIQHVVSFIRPYNFSKLGEGEYTIEVSDKHGKQVEKINFSRTKINSPISVSQLLPK